MNEEGTSNSIPALIVHQWLEEWDAVNFSDLEQRERPPAYFYSFSLSANELRRLSQVYRRTPDRPRAQDPFVQRAHDAGRSREINKYVRGGFPWSDLSQQQQESEEHKDLRMPGWLPTAIIANILAPGSSRGGNKISEADLITVIRKTNETAELILPRNRHDSTWLPKVPPIEIIDGQHRLWAFSENEDLKGQFELPVIAFYNLDVTWQAYLFYTINIRPKRINPSLAFDLYPILRTQEWLEKSPTGVMIYRETRAQELTETLWAHPESPWQGRINMLGDKRGGTVTQAAFIRSLTSSYVKRWESNTSIGGLFGAELSHDRSDVLQWSRVQQAAFLILIWRLIANAIESSSERWVAELNRQAEPVQFELPFNMLHSTKNLPAALVSNQSLLATDQGVRGVLQVTNDMCYISAKELKLSEWDWDYTVSVTQINEAVSQAIIDLEEQPVHNYLSQIADELMHFDWRTSSASSLSPEERQRQMVFRGSGGYKEIRRQLLVLLSRSDNSQIRADADKVLALLKYNRD